MTDFIASANQRRLLRVSGLVLSAIIVASAVSPQAHAVVELDITQGNIQPMPIAIPDFASDGSIDANTAREISNVVANDLKSSGLFLPIDQKMKRNLKLRQINLTGWNHLQSVKQKSCI